MEQKTLTVTVRKEKKKGPARRYRSMGNIPAIIYGHSEDSIPILVNSNEFNTKFKKISENTLINLQTETRNHEVLVKDFQEDLITGSILHIDFYEVEKGRALKTHVPVHITGTSEAVKEGGILETFLHELEVECLPKDIPEQILVDITNLGLGQSIHIKDLNTSEGVRILNSEDQVICLVARKKIEEEKPAEEVEEESVEGEE